VAPREEEAWRRDLIMSRGLPIKMLRAPDTYLWTGVSGGFGAG
jgi:hypothetical protein